MSTNVSASETSLPPEWDSIAIGSGSVPWWWKVGVAVTLLAMLPYFAYFHFGAPGRTTIERFEIALAKNTALQFAEIGELQQNEATLARFIDDSNWLRVGQSVFKTHCVQCHGAVGEGKVGPNLGDEAFKHVRDLDDIIAVINRGAGGNAMPAWQGKLNNNEIVLVSAYVASLRGSTNGTGKGPEGQEIPPWPASEQLASPSMSVTK